MLFFDLLSHFNLIKSKVDLTDYVQSKKYEYLFTDGHMMENPVFTVTMMSYSEDSPST